MTELDVEPRIAEVSKAIDDLSSGKAPGNNAIPAELLKMNKETILPHLHQLLIYCWRVGIVPHDMRNNHAVYKGGKGDCNNYSGISLLSVVGKVFACVILKRSQSLADRVLPESSLEEINMIFSLSHLQEKCFEQQKPLFIAFVDLTKAFDTVNRSGLYKVLKAIGCPPFMLGVIASFHEEIKPLFSKAAPNLIRQLRNKEWC